MKRENKITGKCCLKAMLLAVVLLLTANAAHAHNLWIVGDKGKTGETQVHLYFEHFVGPGDGGFLGPIKDRGETWMKTPDGETAAIDLDYIKEKDTLYLAGEQPETKGSFTIGHYSLYGLYHGRLDFFYGRYIHLEKNEDLKTVAESKNIPFQIVPEWKEDGLLLKTVYFTNPLPRTVIRLVKINGEETEMTTDAKGEVMFTPEKGETYHFSALAFEHDAAGAFEYKAFKGIMHGTTLTIKLP